MSKTTYEVAADILQEVIKARAQVISQFSGGKIEAMNKHLGDEAIAESFKVIFDSVNNSL